MATLPSEVEQKSRRCGGTCFMRNHLGYRIQSPWANPGHTSCSHLPLGGPVRSDNAGGLERPDHSRLPDIVRNLG